MSWDFKLNNSCNHRIINEPLKIQGSYPNYYAVLKRPAIGNNFSIKILDQNNLFETNPTYINYELGSDYKTLVFNTQQIDVDVREDIYPKNNYYATYYTNQDNCPKCINHSGKTNDFYFNVIGKPIITSGLALLIQKVKKELITAIESNIFDPNYGSELPNLIGKPQTVLTLLKAQSSIQQVITNIQEEQMKNYSILPDDEKLLKMDNFQIVPTTNPKELRFSFEIYTLSGQNVNIGVTI